MQDYYNVWANGILYAERIKSYDIAWNMFMQRVANGYENVIVVNSYGKVINRDSGSLYRDE